MEPSVARLSALASLGRWNAALEANEVALRLDPYEGAWYIDHAELMIMTGRPAEALALLDHREFLETNRELFGINQRSLLGLPFARASVLLISGAHRAVAERNLSARRQHDQQIRDRLSWPYRHAGHGPGRHACQ